MRASRPWLGALALAIAVALAACAQPTVPVRPPSLYDRLGGQAAILAVVDQLVANVVADRRINGFFATTDREPFKARLVDQICAASCGPCQYTGKDMRAAHAGRHITAADFAALVEDLAEALDHFNVPAREQDELLALLGAMKPDIVGG
jgi:hemoglobin